MDSVGLAASVTMGFSGSVSWFASASSVRADSSSRPLLTGLGNCGVCHDFVTGDVNTGCGWLSVANSCGDVIEEGKMSGVGGVAIAGRETIDDVGSEQGMVLRGIVDDGKDDEAESGNGVVISVPPLIEARVCGCLPPSLMTVCRRTVPPSC